MLILATVLAVSLTTAPTAASMVSPKASQPAGATCGISTVGYRFVGRPGQSFTYANRTHTVPASGSIELVATRGNTSITIAGNPVPFASTRLDAFGIGTVSLPSTR